MGKGRRERGWVILVYQNRKSRVVNEYKEGKWVGWEVFQKSARGADERLPWAAAERPRHPWSRHSSAPFGAPEGSNGGRKAPHKGYFLRLLVNPAPAVGVGTVHRGDFLRFFGHPTLSEGERRLTGTLSPNTRSKDTSVNVCMHETVTKRPFHAKYLSLPKLSRGLRKYP